VVDRILEKPEYDFTVNTGVYVIDKAALVHIPDGKPYNVTDLINDLLRNGERVGVYPVSEKSYVDLGQLEEYKKTLKALGD